MQKIKSKILAIIGYGVSLSNLKDKVHKSSFQNCIKKLNICIGIYINNALSQILILISQIALFQKIK